MKEQSPSTTCIICGVLLTATVFFQPVGACMRPAQPAQSQNGDEQTTVSTQSNITTPGPENLTFVCNKTQSREKGCFNDGVCKYKLNSDGSIYTFCNCPTTHSGKWCQNAKRPGRVEGEKAKVASGTIAAIIVSVIFGIGLLLLVVKLCKMRSRRESGNERMIRERSSQQNGSGSTANGKEHGHEIIKTTDESREGMELLESKIKNNNCESDSAAISLV